MPGLLIIAHAPLASSLKAVAQHTFPDCGAQLEVLDVLPEQSAEEIEARARALLAKVGLVMLERDEVGGPLHGLNLRYVFLTGSSALPIAWLLSRAGSDAAWVIAIVALLVVGAWAAQVAGRHLGVPDHGAIVIDEIAAFLLVLFFAPEAWQQAIAFALFRFFDIVKPPPIRQVDAALKNGAGVMADDLIAGPGDTPFEVLLVPADDLDAVQERAAIALPFLAGPRGRIGEVLASAAQGLLGVAERPALVVQQPLVLGERIRPLIEVSAAAR